METRRVNDMVRKPPSRQRYELSHPTISLRVSLEDKERLIAMAKKTGKSVAQMFKEVVGLAKKDIEAAYRRGLEEGKGKYGVSYRCAVCGKPILIESEKAKAAAASYMEERGWGHTACHKRKNY